MKKSEKYTQTFADCQAKECIFSSLALSKKENAAVAPQRSFENEDDAICRHFAYPHFLKLASISSGDG